MLGGSNHRRMRTRSVIVPELLDVRYWERNLVNPNDRFANSGTKHRRNTDSDHEIMPYKNPKA